MTVAFIIRHADKSINELAKQFPSVLVTGARQTGKTTLLKSICEKKKIGSLSFDDPTEESSATNDPKTFLEFHKSPFMFDEVQYVPQLFRYIKMEIDNDRHNGMYFLTGSQQLKLMQSATESLSGRVGIIALYPLSAREIRGDSFDVPFVPTKKYLRERTKSLSDLKSSTKKTWKSIFIGGYPEVVKGKVTAANFYANYLKTYIERDIRNLANISDELLFLRFIGVVAARTSCLVNYGDIAKECGISEVTAKKWLSLLVTSGLVYLLPPYATNVEKRVIKTPKLYFMDTGLAAFLTRWTNPDVMCAGAMAGAFFESYVVAEIVKSFANKGVEPPIYFYRDKDKIEIDLLIQQDGVLYPIEIKKTASPAKDDAKNFFITQRIRNIEIGQSIVVCNCSTPVSIMPNVMAIPIEFL